MNGGSHNGSKLVPFGASFYENKFVSTMGGLVGGWTDGCACIDIYIYMIQYYICHLIFFIDISIWYNIYHCTIGPSLIVYLQTTPHCGLNY